MTGEIFFNGRDWRDSGLNEQQVKFLELLYQRVGGSQSIDLDLSQVVNSVTEVQEINNDTATELEKLRLRVSQLEDAQ